TAIVIGTAGVLIRGPSGAGKSTLGRALIGRARAAGRFGCLVADGRVVLAAAGGRLVARAPPHLAGRCELARRGILAVDHETAASLALVVDLAPADALERMPGEEAASVRIAEVDLPRQVVPARALDVACLLVEAAAARPDGTGLR